MLGNLRWTSARTIFFSVADPLPETRASAFLAWLMFGIGYFRFFGSANVEVGSADLSCVVNFVMAMVD